MAISHLFTVLCERLIVSQDKKLSLVDLIGNIRLQSIPGGVPRLCIAVAVAGSQGDEYSVVIEGPRGSKSEKIPVGGGKIDPRPPGTNKNTVIYQAVFTEFKSIVFPAEGVYQVVLRERRKVVNRHPFGVFLSDTGAVADERDNGDGDDGIAAEDKV